MWEGEEEPQRGDIGVRLEQGEPSEELIIEDVTRREGNPGVMVMPREASDESSWRADVLSIMSEGCRLKSIDDVHRVHRRCFNL